MLAVVVIVSVFSGVASQSSPAQLGSLLPSILGNPAVQDVIARATEILSNGLESYMDAHAYNVSGACLNDTESMLAALVNGDRWAMRMIDAMGKPQSDILGGHLTWLGSFDECIDTEALVYANTVNKSGDLSTFRGRYCRASYSLGATGGQTSLPVPLTVGMCVPESCTSDDAKGLVSALVSFVPLNTSMLSNPTAVCLLDSIDYTAEAIVGITVCAVFIAVILLGTTYDVVRICMTRSAEHKVQLASNENDVVDKASGKQVFPIFTTCTMMDTAAASIEKDALQTDVDHNGDARKVDLTLGEDINTHVPTIRTSRPKIGLPGKILTSFSLYSNLGKIFDTSQPSGTLTAVHGIRFLSMTWVILGHIFEINLLTTDRSMFQRLTFQPIANGTFSVDTFFCLSGLLVGYLSLKEMKKVGGAKKFKWGMYYFHRFWRLTPPYMLFLMLYITTVQYWTTGPQWRQEAVPCEGWWKNILYINNLVEPTKMCMSWSWYLANDMQFFVISPILLIPLYYSRLWGCLCCLVFILANVITNGVVSAQEQLNANLFFGQKPAQYEILYVKPWCRVGPYVVGMFTGYLFYKTSCKVRLPKMAVVCGWAAAAVVALLVLYGLWDPDGPAPTLGNGVTAFYNATSRVAWSLCVAWVIFACATGHGGPVNSLLSWSAFVPLSRLSYCAYLVHPVVIGVYVTTRRSITYLNDMETAYAFIGHVCMSYAAALLVSLAFEAPMMGLEKALLRRDKRA